MPENAAAFLARLVAEFPQKIDAVTTDIRPAFAHLREAFGEGKHNWSAGYTIWRHLTSSALKNRAECTNKDASAEDADAPNVRDRVTRGASPRASLAVVLTSPDER